MYTKYNETVSLILEFNRITLYNCTTYDTYDWILKFHVSNKNNKWIMLDVTSRSELL